jgi:hypothetical protein
MTVNTFLANLANVILNPLIRLMFAVAVLYFIWGVFVYIKNAGSDSERQVGAKHILWGLIGLAIMMGVYGILEIFTGLITG